MPRIYGENLLYRQPARRDVWENSAVNAAAGCFYRSTLASIENAWVRPRQAGFIAFQARGSAILPAMAEALAPAVAACNAHDQVQVVIVTGAGSKAFCAGSVIRCWALSTGTALAEALLSRGTAIAETIAGTPGCGNASPGKVGPPLPGLGPWLYLVYELHRLG
ncbi:MAG TPA: enoyl-CoA hydratase/isomerase family protein [Chthoniobacterales bacterium]